MTNRDPPRITAKTGVPFIAATTMEYEVKANPTVYANQTRIRIPKYRLSSRVTGGDS